MRKEGRPFCNVPAGRAPGDQTGYNLVQIVSQIEIMSQIVTALLAVKQPGNKYYIRQPA